jgi:hypothetical protein
MDGRVWLATHEPNALTAINADDPNDIATSIPTTASVNLRHWRARTADPLLVSTKEMNTSEPLRTVFAGQARQANFDGRRRRAANARKARDGSGPDLPLDHAGSTPNT